MFGVLSFTLQQINTSYTVCHSRKSGDKRNFCLFKYVLTKPITTEVLILYCQYFLLAFSPFFSSLFLTSIHSTLLFMTFFSLFFQFSFLKNDCYTEFTELFSLQSRPFLQCMAVNLFRCYHMSWVKIPAEICYSSSVLYPQLCTESHVHQCHRHEWQTTVINKK